MSSGPDVAVVLSGGSVNGILMELGFLKRLRETSLWPRVGWVFGTSAGALAGFMAALDRLAELERLLLSLQPEETFRAQSLWRLPLLGSHEYVLPRTVAARLGDPLRLAEELATGHRELVVCVTDLTGDEGVDGPRSHELVYSSKRTPPAEMLQAVFASAAISALVLPLRVGERIATDGGWVRHFPLAHAYDRPEVDLIVGFRYVPASPSPGLSGLASLRARLERFRLVPPVRALIAELGEAEARERRGEPAHLLEMLQRLSRVTVMRNTALEERGAREKDESIRELAALRDDVAALVYRYVGDPGACERLTRGIDERFATARFPFRRDRLVPRITVTGSVGEVSLEPGLRHQKPWAEEAKRVLIARGYELADREFRAHGIVERLAA